MRILVTGGAGFIGANLVAELLRLGHTVKVLDNFSTGRRSNLPALDDVELIEGDLRSYERVHRAVQRCEVFHQGALPSVPRSVVDPLTSNEINIGGTLKIVDDLVREFPDRVEAITRLSPPEVAALLDDSIALALSSESEGLPRVIMEAFARGRAVVATSVGGIPDIVEPDRNGFLVHRATRRLWRTRWSASSATGSWRSGWGAGPARPPATWRGRPTGTRRRCGGSWSRCSPKT